MDVVRLTGLHKSFGDITTIDGIDLTISPSGVVTLLGPNSVGKMMTIDMVLRPGHPTSGDARVFGVSLRQAADRGLVATVMQTASLLLDITVRETVQLTASLFSHRIDAEDAICRAGVTDSASHIVKECSGGQQQRLRLAMAFTSDPALPILDEPTIGMDVEGHRNFWEAVHADAERGRTIVFTTHRLEEADASTNRIVLTRHRRIVADGTAVEIRASMSDCSLRAALTYTPGRLRDALTGPQIRGQVHGVGVLGSSFTLSPTDTNAVAAFPLNEYLTQDLEITSRGPGDAFTALTSDSASTFSVGASA